MLVVPDPGNMERFYDTGETWDDTPQFRMEHIQYPFNNGGFSYGENSRRGDGSSIGIVAYQRSVYGNSHTNYEEHV